MCDTIVINKRLTENRQNVLAKNSDRPLGECQPLGLFPAGTKCPRPAYVKEAQLSLWEGTGVGNTGSRYAVLGSRPYWLYGFEMGANEKGLFIGNEAEGSRMPAETEEGILGMDLLRFALEAAADAKEAITLIGKLLETYGQNANASRLFDRRYENTFILADAKETWVMETAGRAWAAKKITYMETVSNCYTIGTEFDLCSDGLEKTVRENRWLHPEEPLHFAKAFTKPAPRQRMSVPRRNRMTRLMLEILTASLTEEQFEQLPEDADSNGEAGERKFFAALQSLGCRIGVDELPYIFRDHFEEEVNEFRFGCLGGENCSVCMHANTWDEAQTAAGMFMTFDKELGLKISWAPASPCTSVYLPVWWVSTENGASAGPVLPGCMSAGGETYDPASLWWQMERLVTLASIDEARYLDDVHAQLDSVRLSIQKAAASAEKSALGCIRNKDMEGAQKLLDEVTAHACEELLHTAAALSEGISGEIQEAGGLYGPRREFLTDYLARTLMPV